MVAIDDYYYVPGGIVFESAFTKLLNGACYVKDNGDEVWLDKRSYRYYTEHRFDRYDTE